jgi:Putative transposase DNA-binding domain
MAPWNAGKRSNSSCCRTENSAATCASSSGTKNHGIVYRDDLAIKNLTKSAKGTTENPGKQVRQKAGLNGSMQAQGIGAVNRQLQYKSAWRGGIFIACPPAYGSQHCPSCGCTRKENRKTQALFRCVNANCLFTANADCVAAVNKLEAGRAFVACGEFPSWTRLGAFGTNSVKQEPTEGFPCASVSSLQESPPFTAVHGGEDVNVHSIGLVCRRLVVNGTGRHCGAEPAHSGVRSRWRHSWVPALAAPPLRHCGSPQCVGNKQ